MTERVKFCKTWFIAAPLIHGHITVKTDRRRSQQIGAAAAIHRTSRSLWFIHSFHIANQAVNRITYIWLICIRSCFGCPCRIRSQYFWKQLFLQIKQRTVKMCIRDRSYIYLKAFLLRIFLINLKYVSMKVCHYKHNMSQGLYDSKSQWTAVH